MAKSKNNQPVTINPPSGGMRAWLDQNDTAGSQSVDSQTQPKKDSDPGKELDHAPVPAPEQPSVVLEKTDEPTVEPAQATGKPEIASVEETVVPATEVAPNAPLAPVQRKAKSKVGEGSKAGSYSETFFKKPVKSESSPGEVKPVRISEDSHLLLSIIVSEARRQGHKLNVGDFIDNLLADHRAVHKPEVDALIANWKTRKRFE
ncbi:hypothetical protein BN8_p06784 (plasmid) [Fibrisoma limi BUZ 3]|uniref:DUF3408 domain-containing protein n=1 Tax=Fibrisoma limi BUZ 3 TaxID=1185876 RepID=I2GTZ0_9BACT|nr:DUF3408 domain-containing protein [Fibrisoma limi]CCH57591.1 hypothetical protein BN8_p06784 [Fibrisoma limi BUZ 3]